jgi:hypothetical protein
MGPLEHLQTQSFKLFLRKPQRTYLPLNISFGFFVKFPQGQAYVRTGLKYYQGWREMTL